MIELLCIKKLGPANNNNYQLLDYTFAKGVNNILKLHNNDINLKKSNKDAEKLISTVIEKENKLVNNTIVINAASKKLNKEYYKPEDGKLRLSGWVKMAGDTVIPRNYGDDINFSFLLEITGYKHILYNSLIRSDKNFLMIGSIFINKYIDKYTEVWGSGMLRKELLVKKPYKVHAVRGPKTRDIVLQSGIDCPEVYGDPALLMPYYYFPYVLKQYKLGIIPHHSHIYKNLLLTKFRNNKDIKIINLTKYTDWKDIIKEIVKCDFIVSESLHGLIIAEAYKVPNIWVTFGDINQDFKYEDFFLSINKPVYDAYKITDNTTFEDLLTLKNSYNNTFNINLNTLVNSCPVLLKNLNMSNIIKPYTGKVLLCCIGKMENLYIREFVEYYKNIGFDNICLYDNNDIDGERFEDVINDYIESGFVILKDLRGKELALIPSYTDCYNTYKDLYDWIAFFDIDEFLDIDDNKSVKDFLSNDKFNDRGINCIRVCWKQFTDSGIIKTNNDYSIKKFKEFLPLSNRIVSAQSKCIIKTVLDKIEFTSPHGAFNDKRIISVNTNGDLCDNAIMIKNRTWNNARLNHYRFKTIEEFVLNKMVRLWPTQYMNGGKTGLNLQMFFKFNTKTEEKEKYAEFLLNKYNISRNE